MWQRPDVERQIEKSEIDKYIGRDPGRKIEYQQDRKGKYIMMDKWMWTDKKKEKQPEKGLNQRDRDKETERQRWRGRDRSREIRKHARIANE